MLQLLETNLVKYMNEQNINGMPALNFNEKEDESNNLTFNFDNYTRETIKSVVTESTNKVIDSLSNLISSVPPDSKSFLPNNYMPQLQRTETIFTPPVAVSQFQAPESDVIVLRDESLGAQETQELQEVQDLDEVAEALNQPAADLDGVLAGVEAGEEDEDEAEYAVQEQPIVEAIAEEAFDIDDAETFVEALSDLSTPVSETDTFTVSDDITVPACIEGESEHESFMPSEDIVLPAHFEDVPFSEPDTFAHDDIIPVYVPIKAPEPTQLSVALEMLRQHRLGSLNRGNKPDFVSTKDSERLRACMKESYKAGLKYIESMEDACSLSDALGVLLSENNLDGVNATIDALNVVRAQANARKKEVFEAKQQAKDILWEGFERKYFK
ncbi:hypothetical protein [Pseudomonas lundensis]|uniref:hypothetical protein n=1 Tax=Pseudomonas lundensis TaxID=86185 RepID=UPI00117B99F1|nr:hypothetical protein [Pseudomonas lundensis]